MPVYLGCSLAASSKEHFVQLVEPHPGGLFGCRVVASAMGRDEEEAMKKARLYLGNPEVLPNPYGTIRRSVPASRPTSPGLLAAIKACELAIDELVDVLEPPQGELF